jgi:hypothetical protein
MMVDRHPSDELLEQYALGALPDTAAEGIEEHLLICSDCQDRLRQTDDFVQAARRAADELHANPPDAWQETWQFLRYRSQRPLALAAATTAMVSILLVAEPWRGHSGGPAAVVLLDAHRNGNAPAAGVVEADRPLALELDLSSLRPAGSYRVNVVGARGDTVVAASCRPEAGKAKVSIPNGLPPGTYWVRLQSPADNQELWRENALKVR